MPHYFVTNVVSPIPEVLAKYNCRIKYYGEITKVTVFSKKIFNPEKLELKGSKKKITKNRSRSGEIREDSIKRAKDRAYDICYANQFEYFVTFTLDKEKIDRYDHKVILKKLKNWLDNRVRRGSFKYILFPEYHKDGAIHFHGLCSGDIKIRDSGKKTKKGQTIYNADSWNLGFSSVVLLEGPYERVINYIVKYISKEQKRVFGKYYLSGGKGLKREVPTVYTNVEYTKVVGKEYHIEKAGMSVKYITYKDT